MRETQHNKMFLLFLFLLQQSTALLISQSQGENENSLFLENDFLLVNVSQINGAMSVLHKETNRIWRQTCDWTYGLQGSILEQNKTSVTFQMSISNSPFYIVTYSLQNNEILYKFDVSDYTITEIREELPWPWQGEKGDQVILPYFEGLAWDVDGTFPLEGTNWLEYPMTTLSMPFIGLESENSSIMIYCETPDDGNFRTYQTEQHPTWAIDMKFIQSMKQFRYARNVRFIFLKGNYVQMAKWYKENVAIPKGFYKSLKEKAKSNPNIDKLIGAAHVNIYNNYWANLSTMVKDIQQKLGIEKMVIRNEGTNADYAVLNQDERIITSMYDLYDLFDPEETKCIHEKPGSYNEEFYQKYLVLDENNQKIPTWDFVNRYCPDKGDYINSYALCETHQVDAAKISYSNQTHLLTGRYIDTTLARTLHECYHKDHPMTRTDCKEGRIQLLKYFHEDEKIVVGSEAGKDFGIPYCDYFISMMSLAQFRQPPLNTDIITDSYNLIHIMLNESMRIPLFELVFHNCVVSTWDSSDHQFKLITYSRKRDLFNCLYGVPPFYAIDEKWFEEYGEEIFSIYNTSYQIAQPTSQMTGYSEMIDHKYLTNDRTVQQTLFSNGVRVTVNFGPNEFKLDDKTILESEGYLIEENINDSISEDNKTDPKDSLPTYGIVLIVLAVVVVIAIAIIAFVLIRKRNPSHQKSSSESSSFEKESPHV